MIFSSILGTTTLQSEDLLAKMGTGWRRAFCTTVQRERSNDKNSNNPAENMDLNSPKTRFGSNPSSPRSPFSILKNTFRLSKNSCGVCTQSTKTGQRTAIYTAECSHAFHFPCIASHVNKQSCLICPVCTTIWKDVHLLAFHTQIYNHPDSQIDSPAKNTPVSSPKSATQSYADDEPLLTPKASSNNFFPIPEDPKDEGEVQEFQGFFVNPMFNNNNNNNNNIGASVEVSLLPEAAVIWQARAHYTYAVVLKVKAPPPAAHVRYDAARRAPIDLVTVLDVSGSMIGAKLEMLKRAMRLVISSLGSSDRLSVIAFSAAPTRLLPLSRMTPQGQRSARRIIDRLSCSHGCSMAEALKQATKVLEERRERNPVASIILLSGGQDDGTPANNEGSQRRGSSNTTRFAHVEIPVHSTGINREPAEDAFSKCVSGLLSIVVQDMKIQMSFAPGSDPAEITAVYSCSERSTLLGSGCIRLGDLYAEEEKELLVEIRVPATRVGSHHVISTKFFYKDPANGKLIYGRDQALLVPRPQTVRSGSLRIERLRNAFISSRAVAESRRLIEHSKLTSAMQLLSSARELLLQTRSESAGEYVKGLEAVMAEVQWRRAEERENTAVFVDENAEPLTPRSAWMAAEKLAKVAQMKKALNRVSDLHGFENARF